MEHIPDNLEQFEISESEILRIKRLHKRNQLELERAEREESIE